MQKTNKIIWLVVMVLIFLIAALAMVKIKAVKDKWYKILPDKTKTEQTISSQDLANNYKKDVKKIIDTFLTEQDSLSEKEYEFHKANAKQALDKIMDLRLTAEFKEFHLQLVLALNSIYEAYLSLEQEESLTSQEQLADSMAKIKELVK